MHLTEYRVTSECKVQVEGGGNCETIVGVVFRYVTSQYEYKPGNNYNYCCV